MPAGRLSYYPIDKIEQPKWFIRAILIDCGNQVLIGVALGSRVYAIRFKNPLFKWKEF